MLEIKILKDGLSDYELCVTKITDLFDKIDKLEFSLRSKLAQKEWQGKSKDKCETILSLTTEYKKNIKEILEQLNAKELELKHNAIDYVVNSTVVKSL
jgi:hypothetical protein